MRDTYNYILHKPDENGKSYVQRQEEEDEMLAEFGRQSANAKMQLDLDYVNIPCFHYPECLNDYCSENDKVRKAADETFKKTMAQIEEKYIPKHLKIKSSNIDPSNKTKAAPNSSQTVRGPSTMNSRGAASALSQPKRGALNTKAPSKITLTTGKISLPFRNQKVSQPTNPSSMRHASAVSNSKTTIGRSAGRAASATFRNANAKSTVDGASKKPNTTQPKPSRSVHSTSSTREVPDSSLPPAEYIENYGAPRISSDLWIRFRDLGCFPEWNLGRDDEASDDGEPAVVDDWFREEAMKDFELKL